MAQTMRVGHHSMQRREGVAVELAGIIVASILGIAAIIVTVIIAKYYTRDRVMLDYHVVSDITLLATRAASSLGKGLEVIYDSQPLGHPRMIDVKIVNRGNVPIREADYHEPITVRLVSGSDPIDGAIANERVPCTVDRLFDEASSGGKRVAIKPRLLNQGDWFTVRLLFDSEATNVLVSSRVVGAPPMRDYIAERKKDQKIVTNVSMAVVTVFSGGIAVVIGMLAPQFEWGVLSFVFIWVGFAMVAEKLVAKYLKRAYPWILPGGL
jgi:hypothetical protein